MHQRKPSSVCFRQIFLVPVVPLPEYNIQHVTTRHQVAMAPRLLSLSSNLLCIVLYELLLHASVEALTPNWKAQTPKENGGK